MQDKENIFNTIRMVYGHLSELNNEEILDYYQVDSMGELQAHIEHVKSILKTQTENYEKELQELDNCFCVDSRGDFKYLYEHKKDAEKQILFSRQSKGIKLTLYPCPFHCGWHLAKV